MPYYIRPSIYVSKITHSIHKPTFFHNIQIYCLLQFSQTHYKQSSKIFSPYKLSDLSISLQICSMTYPKSFSLIASLGKAWIQWGFAQNLVRKFQELFGIINWCYLWILFSILIFKFLDKKNLIIVRFFFIEKSITNKYPHNFQKPIYLFLQNF